MPRLIVIRGADTGKQFELDGQTVGIGQCNLIDIASPRHEPAPEILEAIVGATAVDHVRRAPNFHMPQFVVPPEGISFKDVITDFESDPAAACRLPSGTPGGSADGDPMSQAVRDGIDGALAGRAAASAGHTHGRDGDTEPGIDRADSEKVGDGVAGHGEREAPGDHSVDADDVTAGIG